MAVLKFQVQVSECQAIAPIKSCAAQQCLPASQPVSSRMGSSDNLLCSAALDWCNGLAFGKGVLQDSVFCLR